MRAYLDSRKKTRPARQSAPAAIRVAFFRPLITSRRPFDPNTNNVVGGSAGEYAFAAAFVANVTYSLDQVIVAFTQTTGQLVVSVMDDAGGVPNVPLESWTVTSGGTLASSTHPMLLAGHTYWVVVDAPSGSNNQTWWRAAQSIVGRYATRLAHGAWSPACCARAGAFEVDGTLVSVTPDIPVPEITMATASPILRTIGRPPAPGGS